MAKYLMLVLLLVGCGSGVEVATPVVAEVSPVAETAVAEVVATDTVVAETAVIETPPPAAATVDAAAALAVEMLPTLVWQQEIGPGLRASAQVAGGHVIVATDTAVLAFDPISGDESWQVQPDGGVWRRSLVATDNLVVVGVPGHVLALDATTGATLWQQPVVGELQWQALLLDEVVLLGTAFVGPDAPPVADGLAWAYALDAATGAVVWGNETAAYSLVTPVVNDNTVIVAGSKLGDAYIEEGGFLRLHAYDRETGELRWSVDREDGFVKTLGVDDEQLYFLAYTDLLYGLSLTDGEVVWQYPTENWSPGFNMTDGVIYFGSDNAFVHAVDAATGTAVWRQQLEGVFNAPRSPVTVAGDYLYFQSNDNRLYSLSRESGAVLWQTEPQARSLFAPTLGYGHLYLVGNDGVLYAYAANDS